MSKAEGTSEPVLDTAVEDISAPTGISRADTLPEIEESHAQSLSKLQVNDGDFHTQAKVGSKPPTSNPPGIKLMFL